MRLRFYDVVVAAGRAVAVIPVPLVGGLSRHADRRGDVVPGCALRSRGHDGVSLDPLEPMANLDHRLERFQWEVGVTLKPTDETAADHEWLCGRHRTLRIRFLSRRLASSESSSFDKRMGGTRHFPALSAEIAHRLPSVSIWHDLAAAKDALTSVVRLVSIQRFIGVRWAWRRGGLICGGVAQESLLRWRWWS